MRLTSYSDYALRVLIYLALTPTRRATIDEIAEAYGISRNHLMKLTFEMGKLGFIETLRGRGGGMRLGRSPEQITVGEVVRATERDLQLVECFSAASDCRIASGCILRSAFREALDAFLEVLDDYTLADLTEPDQRLRRALAIPKADRRALG